MQFIKDKKVISFEEFESQFPQEGKLLYGVSEDEYQIIVEDNLIKLKYKKFSPIFIDIPSTLEQHKVQFFKSSPYKENLARALGIKKGLLDQSVCDATGGMLGDSLMILALGIGKLEVYERNPVVAALICNALNSVNINVSFKPHSAKQKSTHSDIIYFDPMYSSKNEKSAPKKEMQIFRQLIESDNDSEQLAQYLFQLTNKRLVIKRAIKAPELLPNPSHKICGKSTRYDVYMKV